MWLPTARITLGVRSAPQLLTITDTPPSIMARCSASVMRLVMVGRHSAIVRSSRSGRVTTAPMTLAESAKFFEAETARYRTIAKQINLQPQ